MTGIVRCGDIVFIADTQQRILRYDIEKRRLLDDFPADRISFPTAMAADCDGRLLYLLSGAPLGAGKSPGVEVFDLDSGARRRQYPLPANFLPRLGARLERPDSLMLAGLWVPPDRSAAALLDVPARSYYQGLRLGLKLSLATGDTEPLLVPYENRCIGGGQCPDVRVDTITTSRGPLRVASLPTSWSIGIYEPGASSPRVVDVRSPQFVRDGQTLEPRVSVEARMRWLGANSTIERVIAFPDVVAVVHVKRPVGPQWHMGQPTPLVAFMNIYGWGGRERARDIRLPDIAVGHDDGHVYAIDSGPGGRRDGAKQIRLVQIRVARP